ncbi:MAG TPA: NUDIX hydrolase [Jatrophihabitans sp.]|nr:NUDIX hydrolase [Jatrophihabitans sp.]
MAPVQPRQAASVLLLRDSPAGIQTWLLRRVPKMAFAPGMSVFPGGGVDPVDSVGTLSGFEAGIAERFGVPVEQAGVLLRAAVREIEEETDVRLPPAALHPWARWITPEAEPRRYDTFFFVAAVPEDGVAAAVTGEASHADWIGVSQALDEYRRGERPMLPPTVFNLGELAGFTGVGQVLAAASARPIRPIQPVLRELADGSRVADLGDGTLLPLPAGFITASGKRLP